VCAISQDCSEGFKSARCLGCCIGGIICTHTVRFGSVSGQLDSKMVDTESAVGGRQWLVGGGWEYEMVVGKWVLGVRSVVGIKCFAMGRARCI
jgi:hypothetical protein